MVSSYFYKAVALMVAVGALSKHQKAERREQKYADKFANLLHDKRVEKASKEHQSRVVCYYRLEHRNDSSSHLQPEAIEGSLCTHLLLGWAEVRDGFLSPRVFGDVARIDHAVAAARRTAPKLKIMLSVGERGAGGGFAKMAADPRARERFIFSLLHFLEKHGLDGVDLDWEFPAWNGGHPLERHFFTLLLKELRFVIEKSKKKFLVSCTVAAHVAIIDTSYDVPEIAKAVDFVNLMSYDLRLFDGSHPFTAHHSALFARNSEINAGTYFLNGAWSASFWEARGMARHKIVLGIPSHARTYRLRSPLLNRLDAPASGEGAPLLNHPQVCAFLKGGATQIYDASIRVPFASRGRDWVAFDDEHSVTEKSWWVKEEGFGGVMIFHLNGDDWAGTCSPTTFPLARAAARVLLPL